MEKVKILANLESVIARSDEVESILGDEAFQITTRARTTLAAHRKTGKHRITQTKGKVDHYVNLEGPDALSVELGHHHARTGEWVEGIGVFAEEWGKGL